MVVVKIEMWPNGNRAARRELGLMTISNDGTGDKDFGNYDVALAHAKSYTYRPGAWKAGRVENHDRHLSPYHLVAAALRSCLIGLRRGTKAADRRLAFVREQGAAVDTNRINASREFEKAFAKIGAEFVTTQAVGSRKAKK